MLTSYIMLSNVRQDQVFKDVSKINEKRWVMPAWQATLTGNLRLVEFLLACNCLIK